MNDAELMRRLAAGDVDALGPIYDRYSHRVRCFLIRTTADRSVAEDLTQDTFIALTESARRYDETRPLHSFLYGISSKLVLRRRRRSATFWRIVDQMKRTISDVDDRTPEDHAVRDQRLARYRTALARLSPSKRIAVVMADVEGLSGPEIAEALEIPLGTVWTRLHHARAELRQALHSEWVNAAGAGGRAHSDATEPSALLAQLAPRFQDCAATAA